VVAVALKRKKFTSCLAVDAGDESAPRYRHRSRRFYGEKVAGDSSETVHD